MAQIEIDQGSPWLTVRSPEMVTTAAAVAGSGRISPYDGLGRRRRYDEELRVTESPLVVSASSPPSWNDDWRRPEVSGHRASTASPIRCKLVPGEHVRGSDRGKEDEKISREGAAVLYHAGFSGKQRRRPRFRRAIATA
jgi:hypothetical protein